MSKKGFSAIISLGVSRCTIMGFIVPQILHHQDPLLITSIGEIINLIVNTYLGHGFSKLTTIGVLSTVLSLIVLVTFTVFCVNIVQLFGLCSEDAYLLELNTTQSINPRGLLLAGILIETLGALDDITTTQVVAISAIFKHNSKLSLLEFAEQGFSIGREHIVSLINTLVLVYACTSLTIFIFFALNPSHLPWLVIINYESVAEEMVRTIAESIGLVLTVPITTFLAAWFVTSQKKRVELKELV